MLQCAVKCGAPSTAATGLHRLRQVLTVANSLAVNVESITLASKDVGGGEQHTQALQQGQAGGAEKLNKAWMNNTDEQHTQALRCQTYIYGAMILREGAGRRMHSPCPLTQLHEPPIPSSRQAHNG